MLIALKTIPKHTVNITIVNFFEYHMLRYLNCDNTTVMGVLLRAKTFNFDVKAFFVFV